jgi:hypothetical protein
MVMVTWTDVEEASDREMRIGAWQVDVAAWREARVVVRMAWIRCW